MLFADFPLLSCRIGLVLYEEVSALGLNNTYVMHTTHKNTLMKSKVILQIIAALSLFLFCAIPAYGGNIDPQKDKYAYGENVGWLNFEPNNDPCVTVYDNRLSGFVWAENIGWIKLDPNDTDPNCGVKNDGTGLLSGFAWGENVGWINFNPKIPGDPNHYGVTIDHQGNFAGWAWGENIGWIHFQHASLVEYKVRTTWITSCIVDFDDLAGFCDLWLENGSELKADLDGDNNVDFIDYDYFSGQWRRLCPVGWPLKN